MDSKFLNTVVLAMRLALARKNVGCPASSTTLNREFALGSRERAPSAATTQVQQRPEPHRVVPLLAQVLRDS